MNVQSVDDCVKLERDLSKLCEYCNSPKLLFKINKCHKVKFSRKELNIAYNYTIGHHTLRAAREVNDLGIIY